MKSDMRSMFVSLFLLLSIWAEEASFGVENVGNTGALGRPWEDLEASRAFRERRLPFIRKPFDQQDFARFTEAEKYGCLTKKVEDFLAPVDLVCRVLNAQFWRLDQIDSWPVIVAKPFDRPHIIVYRDHLIRAYFGWTAPLRLETYHRELREGRSAVFVVD